MDSFAPRRANGATRDAFAPRRQKDAFRRKIRRHASRLAGAMLERAFRERSKSESKTDRETSLRDVRFLEDLFSDNSRHRKITTIRDCHAKRMIDRDASTMHARCVRDIRSPKNRRETTVVESSFAAGATREWASGQCNLCIHNMHATSAYTGDAARSHARCKTIGHSLVNGCERMAPCAVVMSNVFTVTQPSRQLRTGQQTGQRLGSLEPTWSRSAVGSATIPRGIPRSRSRHSRRHLSG